MVVLQLVALRGLNYLVAGRVDLRDKSRACLNTPVLETERVSTV
jgi:hypothetical protein